MVEDRLVILGAGLVMATRMEEQEHFVEVISEVDLAIAIQDRSMRR